MRYVSGNTYAFIKTDSSEEYTPVSEVKVLVGIVGLPPSSDIDPKSWDLSFYDNELSLVEKTHRYLIASGFQIDDTVILAEGLGQAEKTTVPTIMEEWWTANE